MIMTKLYKLSAPGWVKEYDNDIDLRAELYSHICGACRIGCREQMGDGEVWTVWEPVNENSDIYEMLATACGCEYDIGEEEDRSEHYVVSERK